MKALTTISILMTVSMSFAQVKNFKSDGEKVKIARATEEITLVPSTVAADKKSVEPEMAGVGAEVIIAAASELISIGYNITTSILEDRIKKFSSEFEREKSNKMAGDHKVPDVTFQRKVQIEGEQDLSNALTVKLVAHPVVNLDYFYYSVESVLLDVAKAKTTKKSSYLDFSMVVQTTILTDTVVKTISSEPIQINSLDFGENKFSEDQHISDLIPIPKDSYVLKVGIKIVESNPQKVNAQQFLDFWKETKEENGEELGKLIKSLLGIEDEN